MGVRPILAAAAFAMTGATVAPAVAQGVAPDAKAFIKAWNSDNDEALDLKEIQAAAAARFKTLDADKDGKLAQKDVDGAISPDEFNKANPDNDTTLEMGEYAALVEQRFKTANPDGDTTIEADELTTVAGKALLALIQ